MTVTPAPLTQPVDGRVERVDKGVVEGWVWRPDAPEERVELTILVDGVPAGRTRADLDRPSLAASGIGDGGHAFRFTLPPPARGTAAVQLRVEADPEQPLQPANGFEVAVGNEDEQWRRVRIGIDHPLSLGLLPAVEGRVEAITGGELEGWAWLPALPDERLELRILLDGTEVGTTVADLPRPSLVAAGVGDGAHAFRFRLPDSHARPGPCVVRVELDGDPLPPSAAVRIEGPSRSDDPWYGARPSIDSDGPSRQPETDETGDLAPASTAVASSPQRSQTRVLGLGGWLFDYEIARDGLDVNLRTAAIEAAVAAMLDRLDHLDQRLRDVGAKLLPVLVPAKEYVCGAMLPSRCRAAVLNVRPGDLVVQGLLDHPTLEALDLMPALAGGAERRPVYSPETPRLGEWGAYCAYRAVVKRVAAVVPAVTPPLEIGDGDVLLSPARRPAAGAMVLSDDAVVQVPQDQLPELVPEPVVVAPSGGPGRTPAEHLVRLRVPFAMGWEQSARRELPRLLLVGGPEHAGMAEWIGRHFRYTLLVGADVPLIDLVSLERPDLVVYLVDERRLGLLGAP